MSQWIHWYERVIEFCHCKEDELWKKVVTLRARGLVERARATECLIVRLGEASKLLLEKKVFYAGGGLFLVESRSRPGVWYQVEKGQCECRAKQFGVKCAHRLAAYLFVEGSRALKRDEHESKN